MPVSNTNYQFPKTLIIYQQHNSEKKFKRLDLSTRLVLDYELDVDAQGRMSRLWRLRR